MGGKSDQDLKMGKTGTAPSPPPPGAAPVPGEQKHESVRPDKAVLLRPYLLRSRWLGGSRSQGHVTESCPGMEHPGRPF